MTASDHVAIALDGVGVAYRSRVRFRMEKRWVIEDLSFVVRRGETLGVIGRNGAGKSTLLRLLAGIIAPDRGRVTQHVKSISLLSLQAGFVPHLTGRENAMLSGLIMGLSRREILKRMEYIRAFADIGDYFDRPLKQYSSGMKARLGFSVAIHINSEVVLIDEIMGVGDADFRKKSMREMNRMMQSDRTVVIVSHQAGMIRESCDRAIWIEDGRLREAGDPAAVWRAYERDRPARGGAKNGVGE